MSISVVSVALSADTQRFKACVVALICESFLHGMYVIVFASTICLLVSKRERKMATSALIAVVVALFSIAAAQLGLHILEAVSETLLPREGIQLDVFRPDFRTTYRKMALGTLSCLLANSVMVWRSWVIWSHIPFLITVTIALALGSVVAGVGLVYSLVVAPSDGLFSDVGIHAWFVPSAIVTLAFNLWCTCLIGAQARRHHRRIAELQGTSFKTGSGIFVIVIESGLLYCISWLAAFVLYTLRKDVVVAMLDVVYQLTGIYPTVVILMVCIRATRRDSTHHQHVFEQGTMSTVHFRPATSTSMSLSCGLTTTRHSVASSNSVFPMRKHERGLSGKQGEAASAAVGDEEEEDDDDETRATATIGARDDGEASLAYSGSTNVEDYHVPTELPPTVGGYGGGSVEKASS